MTDDYVLLFACRSEILRNLERLLGFIPEENIKQEIVEVVFVPMEIISALGGAYMNPQLSAPGYNQSPF